MGRLFFIESAPSDGISNFAKNITVELYSGSTLLKKYTATFASDAMTLSARKMLTPHSTNVAGYVTLNPGAYTLVLSANSDTDISVGLVEIYEQ